MSATGVPVADARLTVSNPTTGDRIARLRSGADGSFTLAGSTPVAITATAPTGDGWAFEAKFSPRPPGELRLHGDCEQLAGTLRGSTLPAEVAMARGSEEIGDSFAIAVDAGGAFHACLPPASYGFEPDPGTASPMLFAHTPATALELAIEPRATFEADATNVAGIEAETMAQFVAGLSTSAELFALGETNHGSREFFSERAKLTLALARDHGTRLVMMESGYAESLPLDDYINGGKVDIGAMVAKLGYWPWDTKDFLAALGELREANRKRSAADRLHFVGFDMQDTRGAVALLVSTHAVDDAV
ncbi:MAG: erythromycin esterase family protein, partial [Kofleriaceae bacterium]